MGIEQFHLRRTFIKLGMHSTRAIKAVLLCDNGDKIHSTSVA